MRNYPNPLIEQRADPFILRHSDGYYYFTASVPEYDRLELRRARSLSELAQASPTVVWQKPQQGPMSHLIWAPELHFINGKWYLYFAAAHSPEIAGGLFQHRMFALECSAANPLTGDWVEKGRIYTHIDSFSLDATHFEHRGQHYYLWAQKDPAIPGNSNLYLAEMEDPWTLKGRPVMLSQPELPWETVGFSVNEGPAVITHGQRIFISYSASATDENYCLGLLWADIDSDITDAAQWHKLDQPVFRTSVKNRQFGPGHNSFTLDEQGRDILVYHARNYTEIEGDPLYDPNRHTRVKPLEWDEEGMPVLGEPPADNR
ncbi:Alpha-N-arabinofuranosidase 2 precursor [Serratia quinivorans]|uniref:glycoside hydrolase family 43 protein n=1 Tax=Serratia quinivorans TaxID=137545 RepID=UPI002178598D|nr:family 43 glycosylhydrolase [Serratia quinivorans]CAI1026816.1 Alpha-N-arabinofuranosidase 2 precursor [Serratia quinivorans]CAI1041880.1 Alpha-N-arabinofuranosidase 2 precursor [Serratia quinivorans]CAI1846202.1 Alpha-N-arabinofuranosidase 2 precursor [Serratia quinivorans]CAI1875174.1 Alpha-N-arabinofuranosidase 2 precursor [Serratia quinivorans]CAI1885451.1 Alpha-N-arabinofuranosidase 2 precursor [Serratia quinivorans]